MSKYIFFFLISIASYAQKNSILEDKIYSTIDAFVAKPSLENLKKLENFEKNISTALDVTKNNSEILALVILNCNKAYYENQFGQTKNAISSYEKAAQLFDKNKLTNYDIIEFCLKPLGNLYTIIGDYDNAENTIKSYYFIAEKDKNNLQKMAAITNLSIVYQNTGRTNQAIELLKNVIKTERLSNSQKGILLNNLGNNYFVKMQSVLKEKNDFDKAKNSFLKAITSLQTDNSQVETLSNAYQNVSKLYVASDLKMALIYFEKAKVAFAKIKNQSPRNLAKLNYEEANLLFQQKKYLESNVLIIKIFKNLIPNYSYSKNVLPNPNSLYAETVLLDALDLQAEIFSAQNQPKKALETYQLSFYIEDLFANLVVYENSKIINQIRNRNRTEKCIEIYDYLYQKEKNYSYLEKAFQLSEQTKSGVLKSFLSNKKTTSRDEKLYAEQLQNWNNTIVKEQQKGDLADISKINEAIKKQNALMLLLKNSQSKNIIATTQNIDLKSLYAKLEKDKTVLVSYFSGVEKIYAFTLENQKIQLQSFENNVETRAVLTKFLAYFNTPDAIANDVSGYNKYGNLVYKLLKLPTKTTNKNLIIIPDGILNFLPFEALITEKNSTTNFAKIHYLLNDFSIAYNNSASFYLAFDKLKLTNKKSVLGIFPIFEKTDYALTFSKNEMQAIQHNFEGKYFANADATFANFKQNAANYSILHLSTHATSGDTEMPASIKFYDQDILYSELYNLKINPDLVVLSACETGIGKLYKSEGAMSVARGFQFAGAQNLLFSLWKVNDYTTSVFMDYFYKNIKVNKPYFEANHQAKLDFLADTNIPNAKKTPYYWSAFVYYGGIDTTYNNSNLIFYGIAITLLIGLFLIFKRYRK